MSDHNLQQTCNKLATDCISRREAILQLSHNKCGNDENDIAVQHDIETIRKLPSTQPEIIRCNECKHYIPYEWMWDDISRSSDINDYSQEEIGCEINDHDFPPDGFCCFAKRRQDDT